MDSRSQRKALAVVKICFDSTCATALGRVEMDGNKNGVGIRVRDCDACSEWDEHVAVAGHHHAIPICCQRLLQSLRDVKGHFFFGNPLAWNPTAVMAAMTRIDHYGSDRSAVL